MRLEQLCHDEQRIIFSELFNALHPRDAVAFSSASSERWDKPRPAYRRSASATRARKPPAQLTLRQADLLRATGAYRVHGPIPAAPARKSRR